MDLKLKKGSTRSEKSIKNAVKKAGFDTRSIKYLNDAAKPKTQPQEGGWIF